MAGGGSVVLNCTASPGFVLVLHEMGWLCVDTRTKRLGSDPQLNALIVTAPNTPPLSDSLFSESRLYY